MHTNTHIRKHAADLRNTYGQEIAVSNAQAYTLTYNNTHAHTHTRRHKYTHAHTGALTKTYTQTHIQKNNHWESQ